MRGKVILMIMICMVTYKLHAQTYPHERVSMTVGNVWNDFTNYGSLGGEFGSGYYGLSWPGDSSFNNYYLWGSYFLVGAKVGSTYYVTSHDYPTGEWDPADSLIYGPGISDFDVIAKWQDFHNNNRNAPGRRLGVKVIAKALSWRNDPWSDFIIYVIGVTYDSSECTISGHGPFLDSLFVGLLFDCDVSGLDSTDPHFDDMVSFDGWVNGEWSGWGYPYDSVTILPDTVLTNPDGVYDQYTVFGDDPIEHTLYGDTLLIPREMSFMYDTSGVNGMSAGYVGLRLIYAPQGPADSVWVDAHGDTARIPRVWAHQWWMFNNDPENDTDLYNYLKGHHSATGYHRYVPPPYQMGSSPGDYRFLMSMGPYRLYNHDTLWFVLAAGVGQGLNGGYDDYFNRGWLRGLRQTMDYALTAYYMGSTHSDPYHPSSPTEDAHFVGLTDVSENPSPQEPINVPTFVVNKEQLVIHTKGIKVKRISLFEITGRKINVSFISSSDEIKIPLKGLKNGVYFIQVETPRRVKNYKFLLVN